MCLPVPVKENCNNYNNNQILLLLSCGMQWIAKGWDWINYIIRISWDFKVCANNNNSAWISDALEFGKYFQDSSVQKCPFANVDKWNSQTNSFASLQSHNFSLPFLFHFTFYPNSIIPVIRYLKIRFLLFSFE